MSIWIWVLIGYFIWLVLGVIRFLQLMGHKNHKDTFLDKVLIIAVFPVAYLMGAITYIIHKFERK